MPESSLNKTASTLRPTERVCNNRLRSETFTRVYRCLAGCRSSVGCVVGVAAQAGPVPGAVLARDEIRGFVEGEMAGVDDMNLGIGHVPSVGLGFGYR